MARFQFSWACIFALFGGLAANAGEVPANIMNLPMMRPEFESNKKIKNSGQVLFKAPSQIADMLEQNPEAYLKGVCRETFRGWRAPDENGVTRIEKLMEFMNNDEMFDLIVEYALFDFATKDCGWLSFEYCQEVGWEYFAASEQSLSAVQESLQLNSVAEQVVSWFAYWMKMEAQNGVRLYPDGLAEWKMDIMLQFLKMRKKSRKKINEFPSLRDCDSIEPVMYVFAKKTGIIEMLVDYKKADAAADPGPKPKDPGPAGGEPKNGLVIRATFFAEACASNCVRIGLGVVFDEMMDKTCIDTSYSMGENVVEPGKQDNPVKSGSARFQVDVLCENLAGDADIYGSSFSYGKRLAVDENMRFNIIFRGKAANDEFVHLGFSLSRFLDVAVQRKLKFADPSKLSPFQYAVHFHDKLACYVGEESLLDECFDECAPVSSALTCESFMDADSCNAAGEGEKCDWSMVSNNCKCKADPPSQDIVFLMDASNSLKQEGWRQEATFVVDLIESTVSETSRVGVVRFEKGSSIEFRLTDPQSPDHAAAIDRINQLQNPTGDPVGTYTYDGLKDALAVFQESPSNDPRLLFLLTDGKPYPPEIQNPCDDTIDGTVQLRQDLLDEGIKIVIIGVGHQWNPAVLRCLVADPDTQIIEAASFSEEEMDAVRAQIDSFVCEEWIEVVNPCEEPVPETTASPVTPAPVTPAPVTPAPVTPAPVTPAPVTPAPVTPAPTTSSPTTASPTSPPTTAAPVCVPAALTMTCSDMMDSDSCNGREECQWNHESMECECAHELPVQQVVFLMDASNSLKKVGWNEEKRFVVSLIENSLSADSYMGVVMFAEGAEIKYRLNEPQDKAMLADFISAMENPAEGVGTYTLEGLEKTIELFEEVENDLAFPRVVFLITDGRPYPANIQHPCGTYGLKDPQPVPGSLEVQARLDELNIRILIIGIGHLWDPNELLCLVNSEKEIIEADSFAAEDIDAIQGEIDALVECDTWEEIEMCPTDPPTTAAPTPATTNCVEVDVLQSCGNFDSSSACEAPANDGKCSWSMHLSACQCASDPVQQEIVFVMDSSNSLKQEGWKEEADFVVSLIESAIDPSSWIGVVKFEEGSSIEYDFLDDQSTNEGVINVINGLDNPPGAGVGTYTYHGLRDAVTIFEGAHQEGVPRLLFLLTDGKPYPPGTQNPCDDSIGGTVATRDTLNDLDVKIVIIGVGHQWNPAILSCLVDDPDSQIIEAGSFSEDDMAKIRGQIDAFVCDAWVIPGIDCNGDGAEDETTASPTTSAPTPQGGGRPGTPAPVTDSPTTGAPTSVKERCDNELPIEKLDVCQNSYAYVVGGVLSTCLLEVLPDEARWGWAIEMPDDTFVSGQIIASANLCDLCKGVAVGTFNVQKNVNGDGTCSVDLAIAMDVETKVNEIEFNIGPEQYVIKDRGAGKGEMTVAPNFYNFRESFVGDNAIGMSYQRTFTDADGVGCDSKYLLLFSHVCPYNGGAKVAGIHPNNPKFPGPAGGIPGQHKSSSSSSSKSKTLPTQWIVGLVCLALLGLFTIVRYRTHSKLLEQVSNANERTPLLHSV